MRLCEVLAELAEAGDELEAFATIGFADEVSMGFAPGDELRDLVDASRCHPESTWRMGYSGTHP